MLTSLVRRLFQISHYHIRCRLPLVRDKHESCLDVPAEHLQMLKFNFGHENFKPLQWTVIRSIITDQRDNYVCLPNGYGKSLCYQYPAIYFKGLSIVISPLISLMEDQVKSLKKKNISACFLANVLENKSETINKLLLGYYRLLYITPESATNFTGLRLLTMIHEKIKINLIAIDEAQCILNWGNNFRPAYSKLNILRSIMPSAPIVALTTSSKTEERQNIINSLGLRNVHYTQCNELDKKNLYYVVKRKSKEPCLDILDVLKSKTEKYNVGDGSAIIYCLTKRITQNVACVLNSMGIKCDSYHAGLNYRKRSKILKNFMNNKIKVIVATSAFGLGVDKKDIRVIMHYGAPLNIQNYYMEIGRAGHDNKQSLCVLFYSPSDFRVHSYFANKYSNGEKKMVDYENTLKMKKYVLSTACRREFILSHFEDNIKTDSKIHCCDNCTNKFFNIGD